MGGGGNGEVVLNGGGAGKMKSSGDKCGEGCTIVSMHF